MAPSKILAIKLRALGDTTLMTAPLLELTRAFPQSEIHVLVPLHWAPLLEGLPGIYKIWTYERRKERTARARAIARLAYQLRKEKFESVLNFHASPSSATLALATGARTRAIHFHGHRHKNRYSTVTIPGKGMLKPIIERDMDTLRALGLHIPAGLNPKITLQDSEVNEAEVFLRKLSFNGPILGICLGASRATKNWPIDRFAALALEWRKKEGGGVIAITGPSETHESQTFLKSIDDLLLAHFDKVEDRSEIRSQITVVSDLTLRRLAALLSRFSVLVCNDSGPKHIAIAVNTPTVTLFGPEHPFEWHPYPQERHPFLFINNLSCRKDADPGMPPWCGLNQCQNYEHQCMRLIGIDSVLAECQRVARRKQNGKA